MNVSSVLLTASLMRLLDGPSESLEARLSLSGFSCGVVWRGRLGRMMRFGYESLDTVRIGGVILFDNVLFQSEELLYLAINT